MAAQSRPRIALDFAELLAWFDTPGAPEPGTVHSAGFQANRLDTLRSRTSAAYRGLYVLVQRQGAEDLFWKARMVDLEQDERGIDIHHIFPRKWCETQKISPRVFNSIVNRTAISYKANRMIGGHAPSAYLERLQDHAQVKLSCHGMDALLKTHLIDPVPLRADNFQGFWNARKQALLNLIQTVMGKPAVTSSQPVADDELSDEDTLAEALG